MAVLPIRIYPDPVLRIRCPAVDSFDSTLERLAHDMVDTICGPFVMSRGVIINPADLVSHFPRGLYVSPSAWLSADLFVYPVSSPKADHQFLHLFAFLLK